MLPHVDVTAPQATVVWYDEGRNPPQNTAARLNFIVQLTHDSWQFIGGKFPQTPRVLTCV